MNVDITYDNQYLVCSSDYPYELQLLRNFLTREISNAWLLKKKMPYINTERCFINEYGMVPVGLWLEIIQFCKQYNINLVMTEGLTNYINQFQLDYQAFHIYIDEMFKDAESPIYDDDGNIEGYVPFKPREYQIKAAYTLIKYRKACGEISTSGGKTLISFMLFKYFIDMGVKKVLYIVPSVDLATQSAEKYEQYESYLKKHKHNWEIGILHAGLKKAEREKVESCNVLFGTFQSLCKRDETFFKDFGACISDECHHNSADSLKKVLSKCINLRYSVGVTGTFPKSNTIENIEIQSYIGPVVYRLTSDQLINEEHAATPIYVVFQILNWATIEEKRQLYYNRAQKKTNEDDLTLGNKLMKQEQEFVNNSYTRLKYIGDLAIKMAKNTLIIFGDVKGGYGKKLAEYIKENSDKNVYYVDGGTPTENRDYYKRKMSEDSSGKTIIVGSIGTFGEGIDVPSIESIFLVNSAKSERMVRQVVGRGIRNASGKEKCILYDFVDDLRYSEDKKKRYYDNYMWSHYKTRKTIYTEHKFPTYEQRFDFK